MRSTHNCSRLISNQAHGTFKQKPSTFKFDAHVSTYLENTVATNHTCFQMTNQQPHTFSNARGSGLWRRMISHAIQSDSVEGTRARGDVSHINLGSQKPKFTWTFWELDTEFPPSEPTRTHTNTQTTKRCSKPPPTFSCLPDSYFLNIILD